MTDIRIAAEGAKLGVTFLKLGLIPGDGGAWLLPRTIGMSRASELLFTATSSTPRPPATGPGQPGRARGDLMAEAMAMARRSPSSRRTPCVWPRPCSSTARAPAITPCWK